MKSAFDIFRSKLKDLISQFKKDAIELYQNDAGGQQGYINAVMNRELKKEQDHYEELARKANKVEDVLSDGGVDAEDDEWFP